MKFKYIILVFIILILGLIYFLTSYQTNQTNQTKKNYIDNNQPLQQLVNKTVILGGKAADAKAGAVLLVNDKPIYIEDLDYWPQDFVGKQVILSGRLVFKMYISKAETDKNGLISQGGSGENDYVLENAAIEIDKGDFGFKRLTDTASFP